MAVSLNALFNVPTREEKFRTTQQATEHSNLQERMRLADTLTQGQMRYAKELGLEFGQKEYDQVRRQTLGELTAAGETPTAANEKLGKARSGPIYEGVNKAIQSITGGILGLPEQAAMAERNEAFARANEAKTRGLLAEGSQNIAYDLGGAQGEAAFAKAVLDKEKAGADYRAVPDVAATEAAVREQTRQAAEDYKAQGTLRGLLNDYNIAEAEKRIGMLQQMTGTPAEQVRFGGLPPAVYGLGVANPFGAPATLPLPGGQQLVPQTVGLLGGRAGAPKETEEEKWARILNAVKPVQ